MLLGWKNDYHSIKSHGRVKTQQRDRLSQCLILTSACILVEPQI